MKLTKRPFIVIFLTSLTLILNSIISPNSAFAGELSTLGVKVSWSDPLYEAPTSQRSTQYFFDYTTPDGVLTSDLSIVNLYGAVLNAAGLPASFPGGKGAHSGSFTALVFNSEASPQNWSETKLCLSVILKSGAGKSTVCKSVKFLQQNVSPSPSASVNSTPKPAPTVTVTATPAPAPTVTVTAIPAPAPTVYVTNPADTSLQDLVSSLRERISLLEKKIKKVCSAKPKPKGC